MSAAVAEPRLDLRLAVGAGAAWIALVLCLGHGWRIAAVVALAAGAGATLTLSLSRRRGRLASATALTGFCVALVLLPFAGRVARARASPLHRLSVEHAAVTVRLTVRADPRVLAARGVAGAPRVAVPAEAHSVRTAGGQLPASGSVLVLGPAAGWRELLPGQQVRVDGTLQPSLDAGSLSVTLFAQTDPVLLGHPPWWQRAAGAVRAALRRACAGLPQQERGLLPGLIDGDTSTLDPVLAQRFRLAGLTHLVAVSGTNCSILVGALLLLLRRLRVRPWVCAAAGGLLLLAFVVIARPSPSVLRAAAMAAIALAALAAGRPRQALPALAAAVLALLLWEPTLAGGPGFVMSVLATGALLLLAPGWAEVLRRHHVPAGVAEALAVASAAHLVTAPVVAAISGRVSLVAIPANVLAEPVVVIVTVLGFATALLAPLWPGGAAVLAHAAGWPCRWLVWVADHVGGLDGAVLPWPGGAGGGLLLLGVLVGGWLLCRGAGLRRLLLASGAVAAVVQIPVRSAVSGWPPPGWFLVACDVGQGDALVLRAGPGSAVEVDAGPDPVSVDRCLRQLGIHDVALLVLSHYHLDHVGGLVGVFHGRRVGQVLVSPLREPESGVALVRRTLAAHGLRARTPGVGDALQVGDVRLDVLGPGASFRGTRSDPNNSSLVLRASVRGVRVLLSGDAEIEAQRAMLDEHVDLRADVLKVPHHGSAYSDAAFLAAVHASVAVISVGAHNDYGQPSPRLLEQLARLDVPVHRTDRGGDTAICGTSGSLSVVVHGTAAVAARAPPPGQARGGAHPARLARGAGLTQLDQRGVVVAMRPQPRLDHGLGRPPAEIRGTARRASLPRTRCRSLG